MLCTGLFVEAWWGLLVSVLGDVLFELGFWWTEEGRLLCGVVIVFGSLLNL